MIESYENGLQIIVLLLCTAISVWSAVRTRNRAWTLLSLFYGSWVLGDLYWEMFLIFIGRTPSIFYVAEFSWKASYLFLFMLIRFLVPAEAWKNRNPLPWLGVIFSAAMCVFYLQWGDVADNLLCAVLMGLLFFHLIRSVQYLRSSGERRLLLFCAAGLVFCVMEYVTWTASCFSTGDSLTNPYFIADTVLTFSFIPLLFGVRKAVGS
jgi:hypothetical protein